MDPFTCPHCGHRLDLHSEHTRRLTVVEQEAFGVLWGPEVRKCHRDGCACVYAPVPPHGPQEPGRIFFPRYDAWGSRVPEGHDDLERWEAELA